MTERLYFKDSSLIEFESTVISIVPAEERFEVTLDATAFYPTGGGQPHDTGRLGERAVLDVVDREAAGIVHIVDGPLDAGARVRGLIDWKRRLDHMQQHTGQHMLSASFETLHKARTESFHLGASTSTIDLNRVVSPAEIAAAEDEVNRVVWLDREVRIRFSDADDAAGTLRKESAREGTLRLIEVDGFDLSACGGTHVARTGTIGVIAVTGWEKFKGGTRVEFVCGKRALQRIRDWRDVFSATNRVLSVLPSGLADAVQRLQDENKSLGKSVRDLQGELAGHLAAKLVADAATGADGRRIVTRELDGWDANGLKSIANHAVSTPNVCVALFSTSVPALVVVGRAVGMSVDSGAVVKALVAKFGGKGGGKPETAQAGGLTGSADDMVAAASELLRT